jgi:hypothetical protein
MKQIAFSFALIIGLSVSMYGQEFELLTGGSVTGTTQNMIRSAQVGIGFTFSSLPSGYPASSVARLVVQSGNIGHFVNGQYGGFGSTDQWLGLGIAGVGTAYGLAIAKNTSTGVFNLLSEGTQTNLIAGFGSTASTNTNRFKIRGFSGSSFTPKDLLIANPNGAVGINEEPRSTFWVNSTLSNSDSVRFKAIAIVSRQPLFSGSTITSASAIGVQANVSLAQSEIAVEGFRTQIPDFQSVLQAPKGVAANLQTVNNPQGGVNSNTIDVLAFGNRQYAELTWQDLDASDNLSVDCDVFPIDSAQRRDKFFISFRNNQNTDPFKVGNKLPVMTFQANGRVGIGTIQPTSGSCDPGRKQTILLDVNGLINSTGALLTSDRRFKKDIEKIPNSLELVRKIQGTKYHFNQEAFPDRNFGGGLQYGFIAQELEQVIPEATVLNSDGYYAVNYTMLIPVLTEALKEQDKTNQEQDKTITELRNELAELRSQINDLKAGQQSGDLKGYRLDQNTPNPTSGNTVIAYAVPAGTTGARITVYDLAGRTIQSWSLSDQEGQITIDASTLSGGLYIYDLQVGGRQVLERKMSVLGK